MIVCLCRGVSDREVAEAIDRGAATVNDVQRQCGAGTECGMCLGDIRASLKAGRPCARAA